MSVQLAKSVFQRLISFVESIADGCSRPAHKFLVTVLSAIIISGDVKLSNWGRAMWKKGRLIHQEKYFSRWMGSTRLDDEKLRRAYLRMASKHVTSKHVIAFDGSDIAKPRAKKMPYLHGIHDGSEGKPAIGYPLIGVEAVGSTGRIPLTLRIFSHRHPDFRSEADEHRRAIREVAEHVPDDCYWAFDRGFDDRKFFKLAEEEGINFVVRITKNRNLYHGEKKIPVRNILKHVPLTHVFKLRKYLDDESPLNIVRVGWLRIRLTDYLPGGGARRRPGGKEYTVVVVHAPPYKHPLVAITNAPLKTDVDVEDVVNAYYWRWGIEEAFRYQKQLFNLEDFRVLRWEAMNRMMCLTLLAYGFEALFIAKSPSLADNLITRVARAFGPIPRYRFYRFQDALRVLFILHRWTGSPVRAPP